MNLLLLLTAFMASLTGMLTGDRVFARVASVAEARLAAAEVAARRVVVTHRPAAAAPVAPRAMPGRMLGLVGPDVIVWLGRRLV